MEWSRSLYRTDCPHLNSAYPFKSIQAQINGLKLKQGQSYFQMKGRNYFLYQIRPYIIKTSPRNFMVVEFVQEILKRYTIIFRILIQIILMRRAIIEPLIFASGVSIFLCAHNQNLTLGSYLSPLPFWMIIGRPLGLLWNKKVLSQLNKDVFPAQMKNYRQLYLVSRRALAYDIMFNHCIYHPLFSAILIGYTFAARKLQDNLREETRPTKPLMSILKETGLKLVQFRALTSLASVISQYWISYFSLNKGQTRITVSNSAKRFLLLKEFFLSLGWYSYLLKRVNQSYAN